MSQKGKVRQPVSIFSIQGAIVTTCRLGDSVFLIPGCSILAGRTFRGTDQAKWSFLNVAQLVLGGGKRLFIWEQSYICFIL